MGFFEFFSLRPWPIPRWPPPPFLRNFLYGTKKKKIVKIVEYFMTVKGKDMPTVGSA